ncbi:hypothetical protein [Pseudoduganella lutea]|uniref:Uncharacterized protein n=1 Tax=Pseudoduganella lutea TaxID=321985 RepID=A0A4P6L5K9_9BURK|nr:hypothetical protein [Pseudoduganella lutea]QBE66625.1 hypothetical protein EWM63_29665 [Pseudoduganella lutea]
MFVRQWCAPLTGAITLLYFLLVYVVTTNPSPGALMKALAMPGVLAIILGTPLMKQFGLAEWGWMGYMPTDAGCVVLVVLYTFALSSLAGFLATFTRR